MNIPFTAVHFSMYESSKLLLAKDAEDEGLLVQLLAGGAAGGLAAAVTNPLDVVKTRLQTNSVTAGVAASAPNSVVRLGRGWASCQRAERERQERRGAERAQVLHDWCCGCGWWEARRVRVRRAERSEAVRRKAEVKGKAR